MQHEIDLPNKGGAMKATLTLLLLFTQLAQAQYTPTDEIALADQFENGSNMETMDTPFAPPIRPPRRPPLIPLCDVDPAVQGISFQLLSRTAPYRGRVRITGQIQNRGRLQYTSNANQQTILLYEGNRLVANQPFHNLTPGQTATVSFRETGMPRARVKASFLLNIKC